MKCCSCLPFCFNFFTVVEVGHFNKCKNDKKNGKNKTEEEEEWAAAEGDDKVVLLKEKKKKKQLSTEPTC